MATTRQSASAQPPRLWGIVPAAGRGQRFGDGALPKQYQPLGDSTVIECALAPLLALPELAALVVALTADDRHWSELAAAQHPLVRTAIGGASRATSVANALSSLEDAPADADWVIVHDAVRPCLSTERLHALLKTLQNHPVGGLLAVPVHDSIKQVASDDRAVGTVERNQLWYAQTPQLFRYSILRQALTPRSGHGAANNVDEADAVIASGLCPQVVPGTHSNLKLTTPEDLSLARAWLAIASP